MRSKLFFLIFLVCISVVLYETKQFASWAKLSRLPTQLKTKLFRTKRTTQNFFKTIQRGKHKIFSFLTNLMNRYRFDHAVSEEKRSILLLAPPTPVALLPAGSLVFTRHQVILDIEQRMFEKIKELFELSDIEYENMLKSIEEIRRNRIEELINGNYFDFSDTHKSISPGMKEIFYQICHEYNINPKNIRIIAIKSNEQFAASINEQLENLSLNTKRIVITLTINLNITRLLNYPEAEAIIAHELAHVMQADSAVREFIKNNIIEKYLNKHNSSGYAYNICREFIAIFTNSIEKIADILCASHNIQHARSMGIYRNIKSMRGKKFPHESFFEPLTSEKRDSLGYPLFLESTCSFIENMRKIWGKNFIKKIEKRID